MKHISDISVVKNLLNKPLSKVHFETPENMIESLKQKKHKITLHIYRPIIYKHSESLGDLADSTCNQLYIAADDSAKPSALITNDSGSIGRMNYIKMLDTIVEDDELKKMESMIVVMLGRRVLAYFHYPSFAYVNHEGFNWNASTRGKIIASKLPYSEFHGFPEYRFEVILHQNTDLLIYRAFEFDGNARRLHEQTESILDRQHRIGVNNHW
jgi:hypothetical protein